MRLGGGTVDGGDPEAVTGVAEELDDASGALSVAATGSADQLSTSVSATHKLAPRASDSDGSTAVGQGRADVEATADEIAAPPEGASG